MNIIISENQYRTLVNRNIGERVQMIVKKLSERVMNTINNVMKQYKINFDKIR